MPVSSTTTSGKRGMHCAAAAYWNAEKDGMWNFKYEAAEVKGLDVVVGIIWISI
jgi:dynein light chain Tctex-type 1